MRFNVFQTSSGTRRSFTVLAALIVVTLVLAACSSDIAEPALDVETVDESIEEETADQAEAEDDASEESAAGSDAADDDGDAPGEPETIEVDPDWLGSTNSRVVSVLLARGLLQPCGPSGTSNEDQIANAPDDIRRSLEQVDLKLGLLRQACKGTSETFQQAAADAIAELAEFVDANITGAPVLSANDLEGVALANEALLTYEWAAWALDGTGLKAHSNALWLNHSHRGHVLSIAAASQDDAPGGLIVTGSAQAQHGLVPEIVADGGASTNAAVPGVFTAFEGWVGEQVVPKVEPDTVVLGLSVAELLPVAGRDCPAVNGDRLATMVSRGSDMFAEAPGVEALNFADLLADSSGKRLDLAPMAKVYARSYGDAGNFLDYPDFPEEALETRAEQRLAAFDEWTLCEDQLDHLGETVAGLIDSDIAVVVVLMPLHSDLRAAAGGEGADGGLGAVGDLIAESFDGATVVDLTSEVPDEEFLDLVMLNADGAATVSAAVAAEVG